MLKWKRIFQPNHKRCREAASGTSVHTTRSDYNSVHKNSLCNARTVTLEHAKRNQESRENECLETSMPGISTHKIWEIISTLQKQQENSLSKYSNKFTQSYEVVYCLKQTPEAFGQVNPPPNANNEALGFHSLLCIMATDCICALGIKNQNLCPNTVRKQHLAACEHSDLLHRHVWHQLTLVM